MKFIRETRRLFRALRVTFLECSTGERAFTRAFIESSRTISLQFNLNFFFTLEFTKKLWQNFRQSECQRETLSQRCVGLPALTREFSKPPKGSSTLSAWKENFTNKKICFHYKRKVEILFLRFSAFHVCCVCSFMFNKGRWGEGVDWLYWFSLEPRKFNQNPQHQKFVWYRPNPIFFLLVLIQDGDFQFHISPLLWASSRHDTLCCCW